MDADQINQFPWGPDFIIKSHWSRLKHRGKQFIIAKVISTKSPPPRICDFLPENFPTILALEDNQAHLPHPVLDPICLALQCLDEGYFFELFLALSFAWKAIEKNPLLGTEYGRDFLLAYCLALRWETDSRIVGLSFLPNSLDVGWNPIRKHFPENLIADASRTTHQIMARIKSRDAYRALNPKKFSQVSLLTAANSIMNYANNQKTVA